MLLVVTGKTSFPHSTSYLVDVLSVSYACACLSVRACLRAETQGDSKLIVNKTSFCSLNTIFSGLFCQVSNTRAWACLALFCYSKGRNPE